MNPKLKSRLGGLVILAIGIGFTVYNWQMVRTEGKYMPKAAFFFPICAFLGLVMLIYAPTKAESLERYGTAQMPWKHFPLGAKILIVIGLFAGALNWAMISGKL